MADRWRQFLLSALRVPAEPRPPAGSLDSLEVFRASEKAYRLRLAGWAVKQFFAVAGFLIVVLLPVEWIPFRVPRVLEQISVSLGVEPTGPERPSGRRRVTWSDIDRPLTWIEIGFLPLVVAQAALGLALIRLDWEMRWYIMTDRSLRIREGIWSVHEKTLTLTNVQNVIVEKNPLQRLLGIGNVRVRTAGGGDGEGEGHGRERLQKLLHVALLEHVDDPERLRDKILIRLRAAKDAGLGDPEDDRAEIGRPEGPSVSMLVAANELLDEVRALRNAFESKR